MALVPTLRKQRQVDFYEYKVSLTYITSSRLVNATCETLSQTNNSKKSDAAG